ncbi:MAG: HAMP domain-containing histidine kinase [Muribaculaceae bacterium]|nr:HAMP domain-containing histidine kinase [Roseburia sp.]MCM1432163.1 HAMP domain-containing histidine kinase [Muribaculaceae bacterium]MCM1492151.1 HAMP domain-containing histidine kinase [Muribaculaceae bacterium]
MEKRENKRVTSISWRINGHYVWKSLGSYLALDLFLCALLAGVFVYGMDVQLGGGFSLDYVRQFLRAERLWDWRYQVSRADGSFLYQCAVGPWLCWLRIAGVLFAAAQAADLLSQFFHGSGRVRRQLRTLDEMAAKAQELNALVDENKYQDLEEVIGRLKGDVVESGIHMQDRELRGIEEALNALLERIRKSYGQQAQFVSDASHELRTPIAVIQGYVNMLDRWGKEDETVLEEAIGAIKNEADHMQRLVEQLLFLARGDSNRQNLEKKPLDLAVLMEEIFEESRMIDEKHVYRIRRKQEAAMVGDYDMLKQSVRILVDNAVKYTPEGEEILFQVGRTKEGCPYYEIEDNGIGMAQQDAEHVFDRFYRADAVRSSETGGTGLGLSIARWITDQHKGRYEIVSATGIGTRFHVEFEGQ